jgi:hypothetical protein
VTTSTSSRSRLFGGDVEAVHDQDQRSNVKHLAAIAETAAIKILVNVGPEPTPVAPVPI